MGIPEIGLIAAAFITCGADLFLPPLVSAQRTSQLPLEPSQSELGEFTGFGRFDESRGDVHTAVVFLLKWAVDEPAMSRTMPYRVNLGCLKRMYK